jgi:hypothetical protein
MPTDTHIKIAETLAEFRVESERRFGAIETTLSDIRGDLKVLRSDLQWFKGIGRVVAGSALAVAVVIGTGRDRFGRVESAVGELEKGAAESRSEARDRFEKIEGRMERVEKRLDGIDAKLDVLVRRGEAKAKGE